MVCNSQSQDTNFSRNLSIFVIFTILPLLFSGKLFAKPVNSSQAEKAVKGWLKTDEKPLGASLGKHIELTEVFNAADGQPAYYIVYLNPSGFLIVSADDLIEPVVGFVAGPAIYDPSPENPLGALVSRDLTGRIETARKLQKKLDAGTGKATLTEEEAVLEDESVKARGKWHKLQVYADSLPAPTGVPSVSDVRVAPLVQSKWGQDEICGDYCYNYYTPQHFYAGCVATAFAQIMRYFEWPQAGIGVLAFSISVDGHGQTGYTRGGDGLGGPYNWGQMVYDPAASCVSFTETQRQAIGAISVDAGISTHMEYDNTGSGTWVRYVKTALVSTFMYTNAIRGGNESADMEATYRNTIMNTNLDAGLPMEIAIYAGSNIGHAVVVDGYGYNSGTLYHHVNMGWDGYDDAWYALPLIDASTVFTTVVACIYNIYTSGTGEIISGRVTYSTGQPFIGATVTATGTGGPFTATTNEKGIYALTKVRSGTTYTVSVSSPGCSFSPGSLSVATGTSVDGTSSSAGTTGNKWGNDFTTSCSPPSPPPAPATISYPTSSSTGQYNVTWSSSSGANSYQLERSSNGGGSWSQIYSGTSLSYLENIGDGSYRYRVKAINGGGSSSWTTGGWDCVVTLTPPTPPLPPASITYPASSSGTHTVSWASSSGATSYQLERSADSGGTWSQIYNGSATSYLENITDGTYRYRVKATNVAGTSDWTTGTTDCIVVVPPPATVTFSAGTTAGWDFYDLAGDIVKNNTVDLNDLNVIAQRWLDSNCAAINQWCSGADIDDSNDVSLIDYAIFATDWSQNGAENVLLQTIYGTNQDANGTIIYPNGYHALSVGKECLMVFAVPQATSLDKGWFKVVGFKANYTFRVRLFNVTGQDLLNRGHTISKTSLDSGTPLVDVTVPTGSSVPSHSEGTQNATDVIVNFGPLAVTAGEYMIVFNNVSGGNTIGSMVRGAGATAADLMGRYGSGGPTLPKRATVTTTAAVGNTYFYYLDTSSATSYQGASNLLAFQITAKNNKVPAVDAGPDQQIILPANANLDGVITDDGLPNPPGYFTILWTQQSGPGAVTFGNAQFMATTVSFPEAGVYVLRLTADDSQLSSYDEITIAVE